jgi:hypothetical protein
MGNTIEVKIISTNNANKLIPKIRKYSGESISIIKKQIENQLPVLTCDYLKIPEKLQDLLDTIKSLKEYNASLEITQVLRQTKRQIDETTIEELIKRDKTIEKQIREYDDDILN